MKMNLSVVMDMVNKTTKPLKEMSSDSDHYAKKIKSIQEAQKDDSSAMAMIASYQKIQKELDKNALESEEATERLNKLQAQMASTKEPSAALTNRLAKQTEKVATLSAKQNKYEETLKSTSKQMQKAGVNVNKLDKEFERLSKSQMRHAKRVDEVSKKYKRLKTAMAPIQKLSKAIKLPNLRTAAVGKGAALLGGLSMGGLFNEINSTASEMDKLAKTSNTLNLPISELQAMQSQAEHAGVSSDTLSASMVRFTKRLGVLQETGRGAMGSFLKNGKSPLYRELQSAEDTQDAYDKLLVSFSKLKTTQEQMAFADAAFGQDGRKMLIMLREGTEGLGAARKELNALGGGAKADDTTKAEAYNDALQKVQESIRSIKFAALAPVMQRITEAFTAFSTKFKNAKWRTDLIEKIIKTVNGLYESFKFLGNIILFTSQHFKGIIATVAIFKVALIALNAVIMANPIGLMVAAIGAAAIAITYLIDKFIGFDVILKAVNQAIGWVWDGIKSMINMLPDALIPDGWKTSVEDAGKEVDKLSTKLNKMKDKNAKLGITTTESQHQTIATSYHNQPKQSLSGNIIPMSKATPLTNQTVKSQAEVALTIKSDKPVTIDKVKSEKGTDLSLNVGNMSMSY